MSAQSEKLTAEDMNKLKAFFPADDHEFDHGKNCYIKEQQICNRLESVDPAWSLSEPKIIWRDGVGARICEVTIVITVKGVSRGGVGQKDIVKTKKGDAEANQAAKSAATDALKRAARLFGIGRYILDMGNDVNDTASLKRWLDKHAPIDMNQWNETTMRAFWQDWTGKGYDQEFILGALNVSKLSEWTSDYAIANKRMNNAVNKASGQ